MLEIDNKTGEVVNNNKAEATAKAEPKKETAKKTEKKKAELKAKKATPKAEKPKKEKAPKKPGVIASILEVLMTGRKVSENQIAAILVKRFPEKEESSMRNTIRAQLKGKQPCRMEKEKNIKLTAEKSDKGIFSWELVK